MSGPRTPRAWVVAASYWGKLESVPHSLRGEAEPLYDQAAIDAAVAAERERLCAAIKAADDKASDGDYMLDSDDCISVILGTWNPGA